MRRVMISSCLVGRRVRYDGGAKTVEDEVLSRWRAEGRLVPYCPEVAGGLPVPRPPAEIEPGATAVDVLEGGARILTPDGEDVTGAFVAGARSTLATARARDVAVAVLKEASPSCGGRVVYDGTFTGRRVPGEGVTARLLRDHGVEVFGEDELARARAFLDALDGV